MKIVKLFSTRLLSDIDVIVEHKKMKNIRLRVLSGGIVKLSVPFGVSKQWIEGYLPHKIPWIEKSLEFFKNRAVNKVETSLHSGVNTCILGRQMTIIVSAAKIYKIEQKGDCIYIQSPVSHDKHALQRQFERWLHKRSKGYFIEVMDRLYPIIARYGLDKPKLHVRKMKTLWGSCSRRHNKINLNRYLYKAPPPCVDYVVLHELAHFLYPQHNKEFYAFLTLHMPDWKERKKILNDKNGSGLC